MYAIRSYYGLNPAVVPNAKFVIGGPGLYNNLRTENIPKICGGITPDCLAIGLALYKHITSQVFPVSSTRAAEMTKSYNFV